MSSNPEPSKTKGIRIATRCTSVEQFIQTFHRFADEESFFVSTLNTRPPGLETSFSVQLADGTPVLRGLGTVLQAWTEGNNPFKTPGVRLGIKRLTANSAVVFEQLLIARAAAKPPPVPAAVVTPIKPVVTKPAAGTVPKATATPPKGTPKPVSIAIGVPKTIDVKPSDVASPPPAPAPSKPAEPVVPQVQETKVDPFGGERTPGSDLVLPANPLMNLSDESLEGYVDCTLYEETGNFFPVEPDEAGFVDEVVPPPVLAPRPAVARALTPIPYAPPEPRPPTVTPLPPAPVVPAEPLDANKDIEPPAPSPPMPSPPTPSPPMSSPPVPQQSAMEDPDLIARDSAAAFDAGTVDSPMLPPPATSNKRQWLVGVLAAAKSDRRSLWLVGGAFGVLAAVVILILVTSSSSSRSAAAAKTPPTPAAKEVAQVTPPVDPHKPPGAAGDTASTRNTGDTGDTGGLPDEPPPGSGPPRVGAGPCSVVIATTPAGSMVQLDDNTVGPSPLTVGTSCEKHKLGISHVRYQSTTKLVTLTEGKPQTVEVTLSRPTHFVTVTSTPSGAQIFIDGRSAGTTPSKLSVMGFTTLTLEFKKLGYQPTSAKLYSKVAQDKVAVRLKKW